MNLHSYPKIYAVGHAALADLFKDPVLVEEKIDGSQFSFGVDSYGNLMMRSKGAEVFADNPGMFNHAAKTVLDLKDILQPDWVYRAEYLSKPKHNVLHYGRIPNRNLILFDINTGNELYLDYDGIAREAANLGLEVVPKLYEGLVTSPEDVYKLLDRESVLGNVKIEGIVLKNYQRFGKDGKALMGKFVSEAFKETHSKEWKASNPTASDVVERIISTLRHETRWAKSVTRLREAGKLEGSPRDIGLLIKEIQIDIRDEETDFIMKKLLENALPRILRACTAGFPEWYKQQLLESAFVNNTFEGGSNASENPVSTGSGSAAAPLEP